MTKEKKKRLEYLKSKFWEYKENEKWYFFLDKQSSNDTVKCYKVLMKDNLDMVSIITKNWEVIHETEYTWFDWDSHYYICKWIHAFSGK